MMSFNVVFNQVIVLFLVLLIGFIARKKNILSAEINKGLTEFLVNVTMPLTIISSFNQEYPESALLNAGKIFLLSTLIHLLSIFIGRLLYRKSEDNIKKVLWFTAVFSNCGFMGIPVMESIYGKIGVFYSSIYIIPFNIFIWTFGQVLFSGVREKKMVKNAFINPGIIGVLVGFIVYLLPFELPYVLTNVIDMMGSLTTPLAMIIIGSTLAGIEFREVFKGFSVYYGTFVRLLLIPFITLAFLKVIGIDGDVLGVCFISSAMPAAANTVIFAEKFSGDSVFASRVVFLTTSLSIVTIPLTLLVL